MNETSPYQPPMPQEPSDIAYPLVGEPAVVKVFGILHLVFAGLGILGASWGLFIALVGNPLPQSQAQLNMQAKLNPMTIATNSLSVLIAVPMIIAGIQLLKKRESALKWSNIYAFSSIGAKVVGSVFTFIFGIPAMREVAATIVPSADGGKAMGTFMVAGAIGAMLVSFIYPVLSLVLLNRPRVKAWFAHLPR
jgi:hypothetical protein